MKAAFQGLVLELDRVWGDLTPDRRAMILALVDKLDAAWLAGKRAEFDRVLERICGIAGQDR